MTCLFGITLFGACHDLSGYIHAHAPMRALLATETDMTLTGAAPTEAGTNNDPMEWDRHYSRMLPARISIVLAGTHIVYRSQSALDAHDGGDIHHSWNGAGREPAPAYFSPSEKTVWLATSGHWSYATWNGEDYSTVVHELGHAYDRARGTISADPYYNFTKEPCLAYDGYFQSPSEAFAQVFSIYLTGNRASLSAHAQKCMADFIK